MRDYIENYYFGNLMKWEAVWEYKNASILKFKKKPLSVIRPGGGGIRGSIKQFSEASARRMRKSVIRCPEKFNDFCTITFPREIAHREDFQIHNNELGQDPWALVVRRFWKRIAIRAKRANVLYLWAREPQRDGVPHYHVLTTDGEWLRRTAVDIIKEWSTAQDWANYGEFVEHGYINKKGEKKAGVQTKPIQKGFGGAMRYMSKLAGYMAKKASYIQGPIENYRHWGRNYFDDVPSRKDVTPPIREYLRRIFDKLNPMQLPLEILLPEDVAKFAKSIPAPIPEDLWGYFPA